MFGIHRSLMKDIDGTMKKAKHGKTKTRTALLLKLSR